MPTVIEYQQVLRTLTSRGLVPLYPNGGAFGFPPGVDVKYEGWVGPDDPTIREGMKPFIKRFDAPYAESLAIYLIDRWQYELPGELWLLPQSHWHFELNDGAKDWLPDVLRAVGLGPEILATKNSADAVAFAMNEHETFKSVAVPILQNLKLSDFWIAFPTHSVTASLHHHQQVWWMMKR